jgi:hypothetical protein
MSSVPRVSPSPSATNGAKAAHEPGTRGGGGIPPRQTSRGLRWVVFGVAAAVVGVFAVFGVVLWADANHKSKAPERAAAAPLGASADHSMASMPGMDRRGQTAPRAR